MQTLKSIDTAGAVGKTKQIFDGLQKSLGTVPNLFRVVANSPAALNALIGFESGLSQAQLPAQTREQIAIAVANANSCDYCLSAHTVLGRVAGVGEEDLRLAQDGEAHDARTAAALQFVSKLVRERGLLPPSEVEGLRTAGYSDGEIVEIVAVAALNIFTNYFNHIAGTEIDFPVVHSSRR